MFTTSEVAGGEELGDPVEAGVLDEPPANRWATIIRTPSRAMPRASGGATASWSGASSNVARAGVLIRATGVIGQRARLVAAARMVAVDQAR